MKLLLSRGGWAAIFLLSTFFSSGCASTPPHYSEEEETTACASLRPLKEIQILTINVWSGLTYKGFFKMEEHRHHPEKRYELLVSEIRKLTPDIIAIQEANPLPDYVKRLAADLNYQVIHRVALGGIRFGSFGIPTNMREGQAILVKKPWTVQPLAGKRLGGKGIATNWFCFQFQETTEALLGRAVINDKPLYIYNLHLHSGPFHGSALNASHERLIQELPKEKVEEAKKGVEKDIESRKKEIKNLIKFIDETLPQGMPAILMGDFNTTAESGELDPLIKKGQWVDSFRLKNPHEEGATWDPLHNPNFRPLENPSTPYEILHSYHDRHPCRVDFILFHKNIPTDHILESRIVLTPKDGFSPSDHYGVLTILKR
jgi:endonuclease/exonuclease/phosphatase family metal-dependent hydrolase